ncbi:MAG: pyridoxal 5'-phosphate synthase glutaminase subunit PdxT [Chloroflexota bacterium]
MSGSPTIGVLALQGAFVEHAAVLRRLGATVREVRLPQQLAGLDGLVIPGGESTTIGKLLVAYELLEPLRARLQEGLPVLATCAGLILLARDIGGGEQPLLGVLDAVVQRNAFGRQLQSFETELAVPALGPTPFPAIFIRAPLIRSVGPGVDVLATLPDGRIVAARQGSLVATAFHPELTPDARLHEYFLRAAVAAGIRPSSAARAAV